MTHAVEQVQLSLFSVTWLCAGRQYGGPKVADTLRQNVNSKVKLKIQNQFRQAGRQAARQAGRTHSVR